MPDSKRWIEFVRSSPTQRYTHLLIHNWQPGTPARRVTLRPNSPLAKKGVYLSNSILTSRGTLLMEAESFPSKGDSSLLIYEVDIQAGGTLRREYRLTLPPVESEHLEYVLFSPQGDKVACQMWMSHATVPQRELWVWELRSGKGRSLGAIQESRDGNTLDGKPYVTPLQYLQWRPGGRHLSFIQNFILYIVPAD